MNERLNELREQYGCGPVQFYGAEDALYERHLVFDNVIAPEKASPREQFEAVARSIRDVISQRWLRTEKTYERENPKRVYYLSMEFLLGRSLANNIVNAFDLAVEDRVGVYHLTGCRLEPLHKSHLGFAFGLAKAFLKPLVPGERLQSG